MLVLVLVVVVVVGTTRETDSPTRGGGLLPADWEERHLHPRDGHVQVTLRPLSLPS